MTVSAASLHKRHVRARIEEILTRQRTVQLANGFTSSGKEKVLVRVDVVVLEDLITVELV